MSDLMLPSKGQSAASLLQELNANHAPDAAPREETLEGTNVTTLQATNEPGNERTPVAPNERSRKRKGAAEPSSSDPPAGKSPRKASDAASKAAPDAIFAKSQPEASERQDRYARALAQAEEDEIAVVTVRVSGRLNEYMDRYVERMNRLHPKRRYRKQDAVAEAFAAFYADHPMPPAPEEDDL
jgi:hypothetical protein